MGNTTIRMACEDLTRAFSNATESHGHQGISRQRTPRRVDIRFAGEPKGLFDENRLVCERGREFSDVELVRGNPRLLRCHFD